MSDYNIANTEKCKKALQIQFSVFHFIFFKLGFSNLSVENTKFYSKIYRKLKKTEGYYHEQRRWYFR